MYACGEGTKKSHKAGRSAEICMRFIEEKLSDYLHSVNTPYRYRVWTRLYTGWTAGLTPTDYSVAVEWMFRNYGTRSRRYSGDGVIFMGGRDYMQKGDRLMDVDKRLSKKHGVHFLDMCRRLGGRDREKMVDSGLISDLIGSAVRGRFDLWVVFSEDDDMIPGLIAAESFGASVKMLSRMGKSSRYMNHCRDLIATYGVRE